MRATVCALALLAAFPALAAPASRRAVIVWDGGGGTNNWNDGVNWVGDAAPTTADVATFDATSAKACTINVAIDVQGIDLQAAFAGTVTQAAGVTVVTGIGNFTVTGGAFTGGTATIDVNGNFTLSGGSFTSTSGTLEVSGAFSHTAGVFAHNGGTVLLNSAIDRTLTLSANTVFNHLTIQDGLFAHYRLDELASPSRDSSGNGQDGVWNLTPTASTVDVAPIPSNPASLHFDGAVENDRVRVPRSTILEPGDTFTVMCWFKREGAATAATRWSALFRKSHNNNQPPVIGSYALQLPQDGIVAGGLNYDVVAFGTGHAAGIQDLYTPIATIADNTWYHAVGVYDPTGPAPQKRLYINGAMVASETRTDAIEYDTGATGDLFIGTAADTIEYFNGFIDDIRLYNRALSNAEIASIAGGSAPGTQTLAGAALVVAGNLTLNSILDVSAGNLGVTVGGDWTNAGGVFVPRAGTVTFNSAAAGRTITSGDLGGNGMPFNNVTFAGAAPAASWTLADRFIAGGTATITTGLVTQTTAAVTTGTLSVGANGAFRNSSTGDLNIGAGGVTNAGGIFLDGGGGGCGSADDILIRSTAAGVQRSWSGAGVFIAYDVDVMDQAGSATINVYSGTNSGNNGANWVFNAACPVQNILVVPTSGLTTTETGGTAMFSVVLTGQPTGNVVIPVSSSNAAEGTIPMTALTFTPVNWNSAQTVLVTGVDDPLADGNVGYSIVTDPAASLFDPLYNGLNAPDVSLTNVDNEPPPPPPTPPPPPPELDRVWGGCGSTIPAPWPGLAWPLAAAAAMVLALRRKSR